jgi:hypothetical protein
MPDRFATGASAIRPTPDAHLSWFHWDRLASSGGKRSLIGRRSKAPTMVPLLQALQPDRVCGWPARLQARPFALPTDADNDQTERQVARWRFHSMI